MIRGGTRKRPHHGPDLMRRLLVTSGVVVLALGACGSNSACNGHPCIGDWQREKAEGGTVVQCQDGTWSHAGGIQGACSHHGGE